MQNIPRVKRAVLVEQLNVKMDKEMRQECRVLEAQHAVDVPELVREYLRREIPKLKRKLKTA